MKRLEALIKIRAAVAANAAYAHLVDRSCLVRITDQVWLAANLDATTELLAKEFTNEPDRSVTVKGALRGLADLIERLDLQILQESKW